MRIPLTLSGLFVLCVAHAQPTYTSADAPAVGTVFELVSGTWSSQNAVGANATWNYGSSSTGTASELEFVDAATAPNAASFPDASLCLRSGVTRTYMSVEADGLYEHGNTNFLTVTTLDEPLRQISYPMAMGTVWEQSFEGTSGTVPIDGDIAGEVVGFGSLVLPWGTIQNVLKVKMVLHHDYWGATTEWRTDSVDVYYRSGFPWYLARGTKQIRLVNGNLHTIQTSLFFATESSVVGILEQAQGNAGLEVAPNPVANVLTVNATLAGPTSWMEVFDGSGRRITMQRSSGSGPGIVQWTLDVSDWNSGIYMVHVHDSSGLTARRKFIVQ